MRVLLLARDLLQLLLLSRGGRVGRAKASGRRRSKAREQLSVANFSLRQPLDKRMRVVRLFFWFLMNLRPLSRKITIMYIASHFLRPTTFRRRQSYVLPNVKRGGGDTFGEKANALSPFRFRLSLLWRLKNNFFKIDGGVVSRKRHFRNRISI